MPAVHSVIDYALARRAMLAGLAAGRLSVAEACDAHPDLMRAARYHGEPIESCCPVCARAALRHVTYAYGDRLGASAGQARATRQIATLAREYGTVRVYVVEVCLDCSWNHLVTSYQVEAASTARAARRARS